MSLFLLLSATGTVGERTLPAVAPKAVLELGDRTREGDLVEAVALPWYESLKIIEHDPNAVYQIGPRRLEEIIAGAMLPPASTT